MCTTPTARTRALPRIVWILVIARAANRLGAFTLPFLMITLVEEFDATLAEAGWVLAGFGLATIPSRLFGGRLSDTIGSKATIVVGLVEQLSLNWRSRAPSPWSRRSSRR